MAAAAGGSTGAKNLIISVGTGFIFGLGFAILFIDSMTFVPQEFKPCRPIPTTGRTNIPQPTVDHNIDFPEEEDGVAKKLFNDVRIVCWVMTQPSHHKKVVPAVKETWGSRCNKLVFISTVEDTKLGIIKIANITENRDWLWAKTKEAFKYVWHQYKDEADWFLKADDDTFVIMENLRYFLSDKNPDDPVHYGCRFNLTDTLPEGYMSGGAGYVLSKEATRRFVEVAMTSEDSDICYKDHEGDEDAELGICLMHVGVKAGDARDQLGRHRFFPFDLNYYVLENTEKLMPDWFFEYMWYPWKTGRECCSETTISFHYVDPKQMRFIYHLLYYIYPYGITRQHLFNQKIVNGTQLKFLK